MYWNSLAAVLYNHLSYFDDNLMQSDIHVQTHMINSQIYPYKWFVMQQYSASFTNIPY